MLKPSKIATATCIAVLMGTLTAATMYVAAMMWFFFWFPVVLLQYVPWFFLAHAALKARLLRPWSALAALAAMLIFVPICIQIPQWLTAKHMEWTVVYPPFPERMELVGLDVNPIAHLEMGRTVTFRLRPQGDVLERLRAHVGVLETNGWERWRGEVPQENGRYVNLYFSNPSYAHLVVSAAWNEEADAYDSVEFKRSISSRLPDILLILIFLLFLASAIFVAVQTDKRRA